jgi:RNA polymerase sigma-70 factor (ECF subfamily)
MLSQNSNSSVNTSGGDNAVIQGLVQKAKAGDKEAFTILYTTYFTPLFRYVLSRTGDRHLSEDICQTTFLKFYEALPRYELMGTPLSYLFTIGRRLLINDYQKLTPLAYEDTILDQESTEEDILDEAHTKLLAEKIDEYLPKLSQDEADVIRMYFYAELSHTEIATVLEKEESYVRQIKHRALVKLRTLTNLTIQTLLLMRSLLTRVVLSQTKRRFIRYSFTYQRKKFL